MFPGVPTWVPNFASGPLAGLGGASSAWLLNGLVVLAVLMVLSLAILMNRDANGVIRRAVSRLVARTRKPRPARRVGATLHPSAGVRH